MPIYEYACLKCGKTHEVMQKFSDEPLTKCSDCGGELKKLISNTSFVLKGSGWYVTDYPSSGRKSGTKAEKGPSAEKPAEKKSESSTTAQTTTGASDKK